MTEFNASASEAGGDATEESQEFEGTDESGDEGDDSQDFAGSSGDKPNAGLSTKNPSAVLTDRQKAAAPAKADTAAEDGEDLDEAALDRKVTITIDGEKHRMSVREVMKLQQLEKVSKTKMNQAAQKERQMQQFLKTLEDPRAYFKARGIDIVEFAESTLKEQLEMLEMDPRDRELKEYKAREAERMKAEQERETQERQTKEQAEEAKAQADYNRQFVEAWKTTGLPADRTFGQWLAAEMVSAKARGEDLSWENAAGIVKSKAEKLISSILESKDPDGIRKLLGPAKEKALREYWVSQVSSGTSQKGTNQNGQRPASDKSASNGQKRSQKTYLNEQEWRRAFYGPKE